MSLAVLSNFDTETIKQELRLKSGYHESVLDDEVHAYSIDSISKLKTVIPQKLSENLRVLFEKYYQTHQKLQ